MERHRRHLEGETDEQQGDTGVKRKLNYIKMNAKLLNSGRDVKAVINKGSLNPELFWLAKVFYEYLLRMPHSTRLHPPAEGPRGGHGAAGAEAGERRAHLA